MIIRYTREITYKRDVSPDDILKYAKDFAENFWEEDQPPEKRLVSLDDIIVGIAGDLLGILDSDEEEIDFSNAEAAHFFPSFDEITGLANDPFGDEGNCTVEELKKNLKEVAND